MFELNTRFENMDEQLKREIRMYGCTVEEMRAAVKESLEFRFRGPQMMAVSIMSDCQEMLSNAYANGDSDDFMIVLDVRQALNRAKWILMTYRDTVAA